MDMPHTGPVPKVNEQFFKVRSESSQYETMVLDVGGSSSITFNV